MLIRLTLKSYRILKIILRPQKREEATDELDDLVITTGKKCMKKAQNRKERRAIGRNR